MKNFITKNFLQLIILVFLLILFLQRYGGNGDIPRNTSDTVTSIQYHYIKDTGTSKPIFIKGERDTLLETSIEYIPSEDYEELKNQFQDLKEQLLSKNIFKDSIAIDTLGYIQLTDTIQKNTITGRGFVNNLKIPEKTTTITNTIYPKNKTQWYIGGEIEGNKTELVNQISSGFLMKNKKDQIFSVKAGLDITGKISYTLGTYWKIKLKK